MTKPIGYQAMLPLLAVVIAVNLIPTPTYAMSQLAQKEYLQAKTLEQQKSYQQSLFHLNQAIALDPTDPLLYATRATLLSQQGEPLKAIENYEKAASLNSQDPMLYFALGQLFEQTNQLAKAKTAYENNLLKNPSYRFPLLTLARVATRQNQPQQAISYLTDFLQAYPNHWQAKVQLAQAYLQAKQPESAIKLLNDLKETDPKRFKESALLGRAYLQANQAQAALEALTEAKRLGEYDTEVAELMAQAYQRLGQLTDAISVLKEAIAGNPEKPTLLLNLAELYHQTSQLPLAIETVQQFLTKEPAHTGAWLAFLDWNKEAGNDEVIITTAPKVLEDKALTLTTQDRTTVQEWLAFAYLSAQQPEKAIPIYEALASNPATNSLVIEENLGLAYRQTKQIEKALTHYLVATQNETTATPDQQLTIRQLRLALAQEKIDNTENPETEKALALYDGVLATDPFQAEALLNKAILVKDTNPQAAYDLLNKLLEAHQNQTSLSAAERFEILSTLAEVAGNANHPDQAITAYNQLAELEKAHPLVLKLTTAQWIEKGYLHQQAKQWEEARLAYDAVLKQDPSNGRILYNKGLTYYQQGNYNEAIAPLEQALQVEFPEVQAHYSLGLIAEKQQRWQDALTHYKAVKALPENEQKAMGLSASVIEKRMKLAEAKATIKPTVGKIAVPAVAMPSIKRR
jgi:tetratricopeptide (TPR) repeat protein